MVWQEDQGAERFAVLAFDLGKGEDLIDDAGRTSSAVLLPSICGTKILRLK